MNNMEIENIIDMDRVSSKIDLVKERLYALRTAIQKLQEVGIEVNCEIAKADGVAKFFLT